MDVALTALGEETAKVPGSNRAGPLDSFSYVLTEITRRRRSRWEWARCGVWWTSRLRDLLPKWFQTARLFDLIRIVEDAMIAFDHGSVQAMHDLTEGVLLVA